MKTGIIHILDSAVGLPVLSDYEFDTGSDPVSYTHLDVYKRQSLSSSRWLLGMFKSIASSLSFMGT